MTVSMDYDTWGSAAIRAAVEWATAPSTDIRDLQKSGFVIGAQGKALANGYDMESMSKWDQKILCAAWLAGQLWAQDHPMPATATHPSRGSRDRRVGQGHSQASGNRGSVKREGGRSVNPEKLVKV